MSSFTVESFAGQMNTLLELLRDLVERESPSTDKQALDKLGRFISERMESLEAKVDCFQQDIMGNHWLGTWGKGAGGVLLLVHIDTVYPLGTLASMPWGNDEDFVYGPGCLDMKVSLAMALTVIERLRAEQKLRPDRISLLCTSDEEIGSHSSRSLIERLAKEHDLVLCLEPALPDGSIKTWRKGILNFEIEARGQAAHAGSDINAGTNAIIEITHQIPEILRLADQSSDTTVNIGVIQGGSRSNVVPDCCTLNIDVRAKTWEEGEHVLHAIKELRPVLSGAYLDIHGGWNRPPMEYNDRMQETFQRATAIASRIDLDLSQGGTGGGSDANFVARLGVPVLDGLGAIGAGAHSPNERVALNSLPTRCALLAALVTDW